MPARYSALKTDPRIVQDTDHELEDAFGSDEEDEFPEESIPLANNPTSARDSASQGESTNIESSSAMAGSYDFERDYEYSSYDRPPPGSPPVPSARALPNDIGNSNGLIPSFPAHASDSVRLSFFRRTMGAILPTHYAPLAGDDSPSIPRNRNITRGGGTENDGVFANVMAKPQAPRTVLGESGEVHLVPEDTQKEAPPSYAAAQADAAPAYWETTIHAPAAQVPNGEMMVDNLPTGGYLIFLVNIFISFFFQFIGYVLTYLLHTSHAAKHGSRIGLGLTLIQIGYYSRIAETTGVSEGTNAEGDVSGVDIPPTSTSESVSVSLNVPISRDLIAFLITTIGWFLVITSSFSFWRIKRYESSIRAASNPQPSRPPEQINRRDLEYLMSDAPDSNSLSSDDGRDRRDNRTLAQLGLTPEQAARERRLLRSLADAGLI